MKNEELINGLRWCADESICGEKCPYFDEKKDYCSVDVILNDAADALETAEKQIAELEAKLPKESEWIHGREIGKEWNCEYWVPYYEDWQCSNCGIVFEQESKPKYSYCPNCGAKMDGEVKSDGN